MKMRLDNALPYQVVGFWPLWQSKVVVSRRQLADQRIDGRICVCL